MVEQNNPKLWRARRDQLASLLDDIAKDRVSQSYAHSEVADIMSEIERLDRLIGAGSDGGGSVTSERKK